MTAMFAPTSNAVSSVIEMRPLLHVAKEVLRPFRGASRPGSPWRLERLGIGEQVVRGRRGVEVLAHEEAHALLGRASSSFVHRLHHGLRGEEIGIAEVAEAPEAVPLGRRRSACRRTARRPRPAGGRHWTIGQLLLHVAVLEPGERFGLQRIRARPGRPPRIPPSASGVAPPPASVAAISSCAAASAPRARPSGGVGVLAMVGPGERGLCPTSGPRGWSR